MTVDYTWPAPGATGWGASVDTNLESMEARLNSIETALQTLQSTSTGSPGVTGPAGPLPMRFCISGVWQARPTGTASTPIISVSIGQSGVSTPPSPVEGDVWLY